MAAWGLGSTPCDERPLGVGFAVVRTVGTSRREGAGTARVLLPWLLVAARGRGRSARVPGCVRLRARHRHLLRRLLGATGARRGLRRRSARWRDPEAARGESAPRPVRRGRAGTAHVRRVRRRRRTSVWRVRLARHRCRRRRRDEAAELRRDGARAVRRVAHGCGGDAGQPRADGPVLPKVAQAARSVSYTHLTLPTNREE